VFKHKKEQQTDKMKSSKTTNHQKGCSSMDKNTRILLGLTDKPLSFGEDWLEYSHSKGVKAQVIKATLTYIATHCRNCGIKN
jgi:hypothetical protein